MPDPYLYTYGPATPVEYIRDIVNPYDWYATAVFRAPIRTSNFFDLAAGTQGPLGVLSRLGWIYGEVPELMSLPDSVWKPEFRKQLTAAFRKYLADPVAQQYIFQSHMSLPDAVSTLGWKTPFFANILKNPDNWAKAFGSAVVDPRQQAEARKLLQASMAIYGGLAQIPRVMPDLNTLHLAARGIPFHTQRAAYRGRVPTVTPDGLALLPDISTLKNAPVVNPKMVSNNLEAAQLMKKMSADRMTSLLQTLLRRRKHAASSTSDASEASKPVFDEMLETASTSESAPRSTSGSPAGASSAASSASRAQPSPDEIKKWFIKSVVGIGRKAQIPYALFVQGAEPEITFTKDELKALLKAYLDS